MSSAGGPSNRVIVDDVDDRVLFSHFLFFLRAFVAGACGAVAVMSSGFFTNAEDDAMIARIRENAVLYDASHSMYKDVMHKDYIWHQIGTAVGRTRQ